MDEEHPLNMLASQFVSSYVQYYNKKIHENIDVFYQTQVNEFQITQDKLVKSNTFLKTVSFNPT